MRILRWVLFADRVDHVYQFILRRLPAGIYGSDEDIDPSKRGFEPLSLDELKAKIDMAYREVTTEFFFNAFYINLVMMKVCSEVCCGLSYGIRKNSVVLVCHNTLWIGFMSSLTIFQTVAQWCKTVSRRLLKRFMWCLNSAEVESFTTLREFLGSVFVLITYFLCTFYFNFWKSRQGKYTCNHDDCFWSVCNLNLRMSILLPKITFFSKSH